jgi:hypothetical protein
MTDAEGELRAADATGQDHDLHRTSVPSTDDWLVLLSSLLGRPPGVCGVDTLKAWIASCGYASRRPGSRWEPWCSIFCSPS